MKKTIKHKRGFALIATAIILMIAGILAAGFSSDEFSSDAKNLAKTTKRIAEIQKALELYGLQNSVSANSPENPYPCPASFTLKREDSNYGVANPNPNPNPNCAGEIITSQNVVIGAVPTRTLNLPDEYMYDGWGNRFTYAIYQSNTIGSAPYAPQGGDPTPTPSNGLSVTQAYANTPVKAQYFLFSHGKAGYGGYNAQGVMEKPCTSPASNDEIENCENNDPAFVLSNEAGRSTNPDFQQFTYTKTYCCGDNRTDLGEQCDNDNDNTDGDGCTADCLIEYCGDNTVNDDPAETCDDGNLSDGDGCSSICQTESGSCGNSIVEVGETCDDGGNNGNEGTDCRSDCQLNVCGDGYMNINSTAEQCDDSNIIDGDICSSACMHECVVPIWCDGAMAQFWSCGGNTCEGEANAQAYCEGPLGGTWTGPGPVGSCDAGGNSW